MFIKYIMKGGYKYKYRSPRSIGRQLYNRHHKKSKSKTKSAKKSKSIFDLYKSPTVKTRRRKIRRKRRKQTRKRKN